MGEPVFVPTRDPSHAILIHTKPPRTDYVHWSIVEVKGLDADGQPVFEDCYDDITPDIYAANPIIHGSIYGECEHDWFTDPSCQIHASSPDDFYRLLDVMRQAFDLALKAKSRAAGGD